MIYEGRLRERQVRGGERNISWCKSGLQASYDPHNVSPWSMQQFQQVATIWSRFSVPDPSGGGLEGKKVGEISRIRLVKDADFSHFFYFASVDGGVRVQESIQNCCSSLELIYTPSRYILGTVRASQTRFAPKYIPLPPPD